MKETVVLITQARVGSSRLPGKVMKQINGEALLQIHLKRLSRAKRVDQIIVATTIAPADQVIVELVLAQDYQCFRGSETDVLDRYYQAVKQLAPQSGWVVRVTSDCPLIDPVLVDEVIAFAIDKNVDYVSNGLVERYPNGQDVEVFKWTALQRAWDEARLGSEREHVTPFIKTHSDFNGGTLFTALNYSATADYSDVRMTVDEPEDLILIEKLLLGLGTHQPWRSYVDYVYEHRLQQINGHIRRNEGYLKSLQADKEQSS